MSEEKLPGYRGDLRKALEEAGAEIGDKLEIILGGNQQYNGSLMPRVETYDDWHLIIKLKSGYNVGIAYDKTMKISKVGQAEKPEFKLLPLPKADPNLPKVSIISTGGTIASRVDYITGGVHAAMSSRDLLTIVPELVEIADVDADILYSVMSENITHKNWSGMAERAAEKIKAGANGVLFTHGTDTMSYSSAALSFALQNLPVPVIFVGSQRSSDRPSSDSATNLVGVVSTASRAPFAEVVIGLHETTSDTSIAFHRGTKVRKCHTSARYAFQSINTRPIARFINNKVEMFSEDYHPRHDGDPIVKNKFEEKVALAKFHPNFNPNILEWLLDDGYKGVILEGTGLGHVSEVCYDAVERAKKEGVFVGMTSQCIWGRVNMNVYNMGRDLMRKGVVPLEDMLPETSYVKLSWCLGQTADYDKVKELMTKNLVGEYVSRTRYTGRLG
jgi:glutamyl-tRNA(Gln) amidotransferase subunit D